jgi:two-component system, NarL family, response regulator NreC
MSSIRIIIADDHTIFREGICSLLAEHSGIEIVAEAGNGVDLINLTLKFEPDLVITDITMPGLSGIKAIEKIKQLKPEIKTLVLSMHNSVEFIHNAIQSGADGFLPKDTEQKELVDAIFSITAGESYFNKSISSEFIKDFNKLHKAKDKDPRSVLSKRELEVLKLFSEGFSNKEISDKLFISQRTVESHKSHIMQKLQLKSQVEMVKVCIKYNLTDL